MNGANYLVPVDARLASAAAVARETIALDSVLAATSRARTRIVILDACRNNPFARTMRDAQRANVRSGGLAAVSTGAGLLVAYAAAAGDVAADGEKDDRNSPYTAALLQQLRAPGVEVRVMFGNVGGAVSDVTGADQQPFIYTSLTGEHYLAGRAPVPATIATDSSLRQQETVFWESIRASTNPADFEAYLDEFPTGVFARLARNRLAALPPRRPRPPALAATDPAPPTTPVPASDPVPAAVNYFALDVAEVRAMAERGDAGAQYYLGRAYDFGNSRLDVEEDDTEAVRWYRLAADQGHADAQYSLGSAHQFGRGVRQDDAEAVRWWRLAADQGHADAQYSLGSAHAFGRGVGQDDAEAVRWWRLAADQGHAGAQDELGFLHEHGYRGVGQDDAEAVRWYRLAAEQGDGTAQVDLGDMYRDGRGVRQDDAEAVRLYRLVADRGLSFAQFSLGFMYENGRGVPRDQAEAVRLYRLAAEQGYDDARQALNRLGLD